MTKRQIDKRERLWLLSLGKVVAGRLRERTAIADLVVVAPSSIRTETTNTDGWHINLGRVKPDRASGLQIWLDHWPTQAQRKLSICYKGTRIDQIRNVVAAATGVFGPAIRLTDKAWLYDRQVGYSHLVSTLPASSYGKPIAELYQTHGSWAFYGMYLRQVGSFSRTPRAGLVRRVSWFLEATAKAVLAQIGNTIDREYSAVETRSKVAQHLIRERSTLLARNAKLRDGYTCQVCELSFEQVYGRLGRGFAEAHHRLALAKLRPGVRTQMKDLVTVCANCHRMLHKMRGKSSDVSSLRRLVNTKK